MTRRGDLDQYNKGALFEIALSYGVFSQCRQQLVKTSLILIIISRSVYGVVAVREIYTHGKKIAAYMSLIHTGPVPDAQTITPRKTLP